MEKRLSWKFVDGDSEKRLVLKGTITEETDFAPLLEQVEPCPLRIDLGEVSRINSCGVREWLAFVAALEKQGSSLVLERCPPLIVTQLNLITNFAGAEGEVRSVFAPYFCPSCDSEHLELVDLTSGEVDLDGVAACPTCGGTMEFDDLPEVFLGFVRGSS